MLELPSPISPAEFDALCEAPGPLLRSAATLAQHLRLAGEIEALPGGANFVAAVGPWNVIKLFPPFQHYQWESEARVLKALDGVSLPVVFPQFRAAGEHEGWGYVAMSRLLGQSLQAVWDTLDEENRCELLTQIGTLMAAVHALPVKILPALDPPWELFWDHQRSRCLSRHTRLGELPGHLLAELPAWLDAHVPELAQWGSRVLLTGEYTPENLLLSQQDDKWNLAGLFDFADAMLGPAHYDWAGPVCFLVQGRRPRLEAWMRGYGRFAQSLAAVHDEQALGRNLLAVVLLHRYSRPAVQLQLPDWQSSPDLDSLALRLWPLS